MSEEYQDIIDIVNDEASSIADRIEGGKLDTSMMSKLQKVKSKPHKRNRAKRNKFFKRKTGGVDDKIDSYRQKIKIYQDKIDLYERKIKSYQDGDSEDSGEDDDEDIDESEKEEVKGGDDILNELKISFNDSPTEDESEETPIGEDEIFEDVKVVDL